MKRSRCIAVAIGLAATALAVGVLAADPMPAQPVPGALDTGSLAGSALRMVLSLGVVLGLVAALAWVARRLRAGGRLKSGLIEVVSGVSLGAREKVVLLRVGQEQVLVGVSPAGMRALHVMRDTEGSQRFATLMEQKP